MSESCVPVLSIQSDWNEALRKIMGECWISCKFRDQPGVHGKIKNEGVLNGEPAYVASCETFAVGDVSSSTIAIIHTPSNHKCVFVAPTKSFSGLHKKAVVSVSVAPGGLGVSVCTENKLIVWDTTMGLARRVLSGHVGDVYKCRFFPSGVVVLSGGTDMQLKIWSTETGQCPVTLLGHTAAVMDMCIVERGRNIISVSKDGTAKLWDCGQSVCLGTLVSHNVPINCCAVMVVDGELDMGEPEELPSEREVGTEGKIVIVGYEDGTVEGIAVRSRRSMFRSTLPSAINCVTVLRNHNFIVGCQDGQISLFSIHSTSVPIKTWLESNSAALSMLTVFEGFLVGRADGLCTYHPFLSSGPDSFRVVMTGSDCDPIYDMTCDGSHIFTACRDSVIRKYDLQTIKASLIDKTTVAD